MKYTSLREQQQQQLTILWRKFIKKAYHHYIVKDHNHAMHRGYGLCFDFNQFVNDRNNLSEFICDAYCNQRIAQYRHKPVEYLPWKYCLLSNPAPRKRFIAHEAKRLGIAP